MPAGKPTFAKFGARKRERYLQSLRQGSHRMTAARKAGVSAELVRLYRNKHAAFRAREEAAELEACGSVEDALFRAAVEDRNVVACQVWLYNRAPGRWADRRNLNVEAGVTLEVVERVVRTRAEARDGQPQPGPGGVPG